MVAISFCSTLTHCFCINVTSGAKEEKYLAYLQSDISRGVLHSTLPGRKTQPGNSIGSQRTSPVGVPNFGASDLPIEWRFPQLHNTTCEEYQCKNPLQAYLEKYTKHHCITYSFQNFGSVVHYDVDIYLPRFKLGIWPGA